jgi:hypothetical protein
MPITAAIVGGISAVGSIGGAAIQSNAAGNAASTQEQAAQSVIKQANQAASTASSGVNSATGLANSTLAGGLTAQQAALAPYLTAGTTSLSQLQNALTGLSSPSSQFSFNPTTSPQLQFEQQQSQQALQRQAAASGTVLGGGEDRASNIMNTGLASTYLNSAFNNALSTYNTNRQNTLTQIQGLTNLTGLGYNATGANVQAIGNTAAQTAANKIGAATYSGQTGLQAAQIAEGATTGAANANSAATLAQGNAYGNLVGNLGSSAAGLYGLSQSPNFGAYGNNNNSPVGGNGEPIGTLDTTVQSEPSTTYV